MTDQAMDGPHPADRGDSDTRDDGGEFLFDRAAVVGVGLIGGSVGMALRARELAGEVVAVARRDETLELALARGAADRATRDISEAVAGADLVVLAAPVSLIIEHLGLVAGVVDAECIITDVGSVKQPIVAAAERVLRRPGRFVGGHPLAGSERKGIAAARPDLLESAAWALTPTGVTDEETLDRVEDLVARLGARSLLLSPLEHDQLVARTSHLPHVVAAALVNVVAQRTRERADTLDVIGQGFRDTTRVAGGDASLWADIALANADALLESLAEMNASLEGFAAALRSGSREELEQLLADAQRAREGM
jgi:prephenate dehydrogenase